MNGNRRSLFVHMYTLPIQLLITASAESCQVLSRTGVMSDSGSDGIGLPQRFALITRARYSVSTAWIRTEK
jgi:hypothetical protein